MTTHTVKASLAVLAFTATALLTACGNDDASSNAEGPPASEHTVEFRPVLLAGSSTPGPDGTLIDPNAVDQVLSLMGTPEAESSEAADWLTTGGCSMVSVSNAELATSCSSDDSEMFLLGPSALDGSHVAQAEFDDEGDNGESVMLILDDAGASAFSDLTAEALAQPAPANRIAIVLDGTVLSSPTVQSEITNGEIVVTGPPGDEGVRALAAALD